MNTEPVSVTQVTGQDAADVVTESVAPTLQLADYELLHKLGSGGYGEVWRATGPGGLPKAVKILYGERHGEHAEAEMKALERMRDLRHPFLLSIEVIDSRLIVVTELADGNLTDRFTEYRQDGKRGIPRDELLGYLRDAADALDFMFEQQGLQHLDIKPDNILLQGNHAKVGDFGLAKDLNATNVSVVNGFTPLYAAPELFEGRPGRATDQYSLAIVYQTMLTGKPPFSGRTAAQLTAQHLRSQPDLTDLQPIDRPVIARALSKNTNSRYESCRQFVDELSRRRNSKSRQTVAVPAELDANNPVMLTELVKTKGTSGVKSALDTPSDPMATVVLPADKVTVRPSVVIGVGGLGCAVALEFKTQLQNQNPKASELFPLLAIDSSRESLSELRPTDEAPGISLEQSIATPLRSSKQYRGASDVDLSWLSRRWLFNIPRSCQVDGIRPLGRLALCDHYEKVSERIAELLRQAHEEDAREKVGQFCGLPTEDGLDVYLVGATCGGTASGMLNDLGILVAQIARQEKISGVTVHGVLMHATGVVRKSVDVQEANTASMIKELDHLSTPGLSTARGFDNDPATRAQAPFDEKYFLHLGDNLSSFDFADQAERVGQLLVAMTCTGAKAELASWRADGDAEFESTNEVRLLGFGAQDAASFASASRECRGLTQGVIRHWFERGDENDPDFQTHLTGYLSDVQRLLTDLKLTEETQTRQVMQLLRGEIGKEIESYANHVNQHLIVQVAPETVTHNELLDAISAYLSAQAPAGAIKTLHQIVGDVQKTLNGTTRNCELAIVKHLREQLNSPHRIRSTELVTQFVQNNLKKTRQHCNGLLTDIEKAFRDLVGSDNPDSQFAVQSQMLPIEQVMAFGQQYCVLLAYQTVYQCFLHHMDQLISSIAEFQTSVESIREQLWRELQDTDENAEGVDQETSEAFDQYLRSASSDLLADHVGSGNDGSGLMKSMSAAALQFLVAAGTQDDRTAVSDEKAFPENAWPNFRKLGGRRRVLATIPEHLSLSEWTDRLKKEFGDCVATRTVNDSRVTALCQIEGVPLGGVFARLTHNNPHVAEVAARVHTRNDVEW